MSWWKTTARRFANSSRFSVMAFNLSSCNILQNWCFRIELKELTVNYTFPILQMDFLRVTVQTSRQLKSIVLNFRCTFWYKIQASSPVTNLFKKGFLSCRWRSKSHVETQFIRPVSIAVEFKFYIDRHILSWSGDYVSLFGNVNGMLITLSHTILQIFNMILIRSVAAGQSAVFIFQVKIVKIVLNQSRIVVASL